MNPFTKLPPLPPGSTGERQFPSAQAAKDHAAAKGVSSFVVMAAGQEYAWIAPIEAFTARAFPALAAGIRVVEIVQK